MADKITLTVDTLMVVLKSAFTAGSLACPTAPCDVDAAWAESLTRANAEAYTAYMVKQQRPEPRTLAELAAEIERRMIAEGIAE